GAKGMDLVVANRVGRNGIGFGSDDNEVMVIDKEGHEEKWPRMSKDEIAMRLMQLVARRFR
ncbi:MAG: bifunctional 4'-phosphopantothenoylcysteine decarboxylase/phosphopantothenoylcysteine synthetase, partial [Acidobacteriota bacterium]